MDSPSTFGSIPLGQRPALLAARPRRRVRREVLSHSEMHGHSRSPGCAAITVANPFAERLVGSVRRECVDHVIVFHEAGLRRILKDYFEYYERCGNKDERHF